MGDKVLYSPTTLPSVPGNDRKWLSDELRKIARAIGYLVIGPMSATQITPLAFVALFTSAEQTAIWGSSIAAVRLFLFKTAASGFLDLTDPTASAFLDLLVSNSLLTSSRKPQVLAGTVQTT